MINPAQKLTKRNLVLLSAAKFGANSAAKARSRKLILTFWSIGYKPKKAAIQLNAANIRSAIATNRPFSPIDGFVSG